MEAAALPGFIYSLIMLIPLCSCHLSTLLLRCKMNRMVKHSYMVFIVWDLKKKKSEPSVFIPPLKIYLLSF